MISAAAIEENFVSVENSTLLIGKTLDLVAAFTNAEAGIDFNHDVEWSINSEAKGFAKLSKDGLLTAISAGPITVTATDNEKNVAAKTTINSVNENYNILCLKKCSSYISQWEL